MKTSTSLFGIFTIATALLTLCSSAQGQSSSQIYVYGTWNTGTSSGFTSSMPIPQFNSALGVLNSVSLEFTVDYSSTLTISGLPGTPSVLAANAIMTFQDPGVNISRHFSASWQGVYTLPSSPNIGGEGFNNDLAPVSYNSPAVLSEFTGNGNFNLQVIGSQSFVPITGPPVGVTINSATFGASALVTYTYTAVPEPGALSLLAIGFGMMLMVRKAAQSHLIADRFPKPAADGFPVTGDALSRKAGGVRNSECEMLDGTSRRMEN